jgi:hypothetical protein
MRVYWRNGELQVKPESRADTLAINKLQEFFGGLGFPVHDDDLEPEELERGQRGLPSALRGDISEGGDVARDHNLSDN